VSPNVDDAPARGARALRAGFLLAILFLAAYYTYIAFAELSYLSSAGRLGPGFFPRLIGSGLVAMCVLSLYLDLKGGSEGAGVSPFWRTAVAVALLSAIFVALLDVLGGLLSMIAFLGGTLGFLNRGRHLQNAAIALLMPLAVYLLFVVWLKASLPRGILPLPF
jgi:hypothetical protein